MKNTLYILLLIIASSFIQCKEKAVEINDSVIIPRAEATTGRYTLAHGSLNIPEIKGVRTTVDVKNLGNESGRSCWAAMHIGSNVWIQVGYRNNAIPVLEYYYGTITDITILNGGVAPMNKGQKNSFFIKNISDSIWEAGRNNVSTIRFNGGADYGSNPQTGIEYSSSNSKFPLLNFYPAIEVLVNGEWTTPPAAYIQYRGKWGIEGNLQNPALRVNELNMGGATSTTGSGFLWIVQ